MCPTWIQTFLFVGKDVVKYRYVNGTGVYVLLPLEHETN